MFNVPWDITSIAEMINVCFDRAVRYEIFFLCVTLCIFSMLLKNFLKIRPSFRGTTGGKFFILSE